MKMFNILLLIAIFGLVSCSGGKTKNKESTNGSALAAEDQDDESLFEDEGDSDDLGFADDSSDDFSDDKSVSVNTDDSSMDYSSGQYTVSKGDTLMLVAYKIYGDYGKWKDLRDMNSGINSSSLTAGSVLQFTPPAEKFIHDHNGTPYLIQSGDTLGTISNDKYGTVKKWKDIYENNKVLIKDPNLIFAGFTLYYVAEDRSVASSDDF